MYLELSEGPEMYLQQGESMYLQQSPDMYLQQGGDPMDFYVYVPNQQGGGEYVREDLLDEMLTDEQFDMVLDMQPGMSGLFGNKAARQARRADRQSKRARRREARTQIKEQKAAGTRQTGGEKIFSTLTNITGAARDIFGGGGGQAPAGMSPELRGVSFDGSFQAGQTPPPGGNFLGRYGIPLAIAGAAILFFATRKK